VFLKGSEYFCYPSYYMVADSMSMFPYYLDRKEIQNDFHCVSLHVRVGTISEFTCMMGIA